MTTIPSRLKLRNFACLILVAATMYQANAADAPRPELHIQLADRVPGADTSMMLAATRAGKRVVAVGDHGVVLLSDDAGQVFLQAKSVPTGSMLTGVSFADPNTGWAVGQWGVIVKTQDGGQSWSLQRSDLSVDQPLFSVYFRNSNEGWAVGLWSLLLHTTDGGTTWSSVILQPPPGSKKADRNLYRIFADTRGTLFIACEGRVIRSDDDGNSWTYLETGYSGSFWSGVALQDDTLLVGGLRGTIYRSTDHGTTWSAAQSPYKSSITDMLQLSDKSIIAVGLDGVSLISRDDGVTFKGNQRADRVPFTAVSESSSGLAVMFSTNGPIK